MFNKELRFYQRNKPQYLKKFKDKYLVIKENKLLGAYKTEEEAYESGLEEYGQAPFLIKKAEELEPTANFPALYVGVKNASI